MSQSSSSLGSNNPFRRKAAAAPVPQSPDGSSASFASLPAVDGLAVTNLALPTNTSLLPSSDQFRNHLQTLAQSSQPAPATTFQKAKVVKKVRVQSPPPSSPESSGIPDQYSLAGRGSYRAYEDDDESESSDDEADTDDEIRTRDPFGNQPIRASSEEDDELFTQREALNSFQKSSEGPGAVLTKDTSASGTTKGRNPGVRTTLDVNAFGRLLLTGESGNSESVSSARLQSTKIEKPPRAVPEASRPAEPEADRQPVAGRAQARKPPPPAPSSRHGKLINVELRTGSASTTTTPTLNAARAPSLSSQSDAELGLNLPSTPLQQFPPTPSDINKPLPPAPFGPGQNEAESIFDREAAGKVPELDVDLDEMHLHEKIPPTLPNLSPSASIPSSPLAPSPIKPPPPPRRNPHGRSDSKLSVTGLPTTASPAQLDGVIGEASQRRSSQESVRSRSSSLRANIYAPAPPPPRRSGHAPPPPPQRGTNSLVSPSTSSFSSFTTPTSIAEQTPSLADADESRVLEQATSPNPVTQVQGLHQNHSSSTSKLPPPPPPPARSVSVRSKPKRPASVSSMEGTSRRVTGSAPPPPPPPKASRQRGGSKGSLDGSTTAAGAGAGRSSIDSVRPKVLPGTLAEEPGLTGDSLTALDNGAGTGMSSANDILADLTALQREVDALRGRYEKEQ